MPELQQVISKQMYGGLSSELLWQPADSPLGLGMRQTM